MNFACLFVLLKGSGLSGSRPSAPSESGKAAESRANVRPDPDKSDNLRHDGDYDESAICSHFH